MSNRHVVITHGVRTAIGKIGKSLKDICDTDLAALVMEDLLQNRAKLDPKEVDQIIFGEVKQKASPANVARVAALKAGIPESAPSYTVNRQCGSGLQAIIDAYEMIATGEADVIVAGGVESMSMVPMLVGAEDADPWLMEHRPEVYTIMGITAENVARQWNVSREDMDAMAVESHHRAAKAQAEGCFDDQIIPVTVPGPDGKDVVITKDEGIRPGCNIESLSQLKPCFLENGSVTAATSSQRTDGAGFVVIMSEEKAKELGVKPLARFVSYATGGVPAEVMGVGPIEAVPKVLKKTGMTIDQMDTIELNEAFASQALAVIRTTGMDPAKVNPWGGAMALGHPLGATGAMLTCKVLSYLQRTGGKYGMVTMCIGGGMGAAGIFEMM